MLFLQSAQTSNNTGDWFKVNTTGEYIFRYFGTFDGCNIELQTKATDEAGNVEGIPVPNTSQDTAYTALVYLEAGAEVRAVVASAGGSTNVDVTLNKAH